MDHISCVSIAILTVFSICSTSHAISSQAKFEPPDGKKLFIIGQDNETIENYIKSEKVIPAGFMVYTSIQKMEGLDNESPDYGSGTMCADTLIKKYPNTVLQIGLYMVDALQDTYNGVYDDNIKKLAMWLKNANVPVFLRIGYECDGAHNCYNPVEYIKAYHYIVDKLRSYQVNNVAFVWHVHAHKIKPELDQFYPGDNYVDWVGLTYFNQSESMMEPVLKFAKLHKKPVMAAESTPKGVGSGNGTVSWSSWYNHFFSFVNRKEIKAFSYINCNWEQYKMWKGQGWNDARVEANDYVRIKWENEINKDRYLKASNELYNILSGKKL